MTRFGSKIVGIDLGTTNTLVGYYDDIANRGECCVSKEGTKLTASAVYFEKLKKSVVGNVAKESALLYPKRTAMNFKRLMGVTKEAISIDGKIFSPQQLSALIIKNVIEDAKVELEDEIVDVVITVPAYFDSAGRQATIEAGKMAGLNVVDIIDEPVAALYQCDSMNNLSGKTVLVFDLGGGTLDLVALDISEDEIEEVAINGNIHLGGSDWDEALIQYIRSKYLDGKTLDEDDEQKLALDVERAKKVLSYNEQTRITLNYREGRQSVIITKQEFEECTRPLLLKVRETIQELMNDLLDKGIYRFDKILMVGGASRMVQIEELLKNLFPDAEILGKDYDEAVAKGAAVYGRTLLKMDKPCQLKSLIKLKTLKRISTRSYGLAALLGEEGGKVICNMIHRGEKLPITATKEFFTHMENQSNVDIQVYESVSKERYVDIEEAVFLGNCVLEIKEELPKNSRILVNFSLKEDGTLFVEAKEIKGNAIVKTIMESKALLDDEDFRIQKDEIDKLIKQ